MSTEILQHPAVEALLQFELQTVAHRMGLAEPPQQLEASDVVKALNLAEQLSRSSNTEDWAGCLLICALAWEHRQAEWKALPSFLTELLLRIGLAPTALMLSPGRENGQYASVGSSRREMELAARLIDNVVYAADSVELDLSDFQARVWHAIDEHRYVGLSAPTSAGKSFVLAHRIADLLFRRSGEVLYVVPTITLINQVTRDLRRAFQRLRVENAVVTQTYSPKYLQQSDRIVYVLTQERAQSALAQWSDAFRNLELLVIDEVQNVERVAKEDHERSRTLYDVIVEIVAERNPRRVVFAGPRVDGLEQFARDLLGPEAVGLTDTLPPVVNLTYSFEKHKRGTVLHQYSALGESQLKLQLNGATSTLRTTFGKRLYKTDFFQFLATILPGLEKDGGVLIFSPTSTQATKTALELSLLRDQLSASKLAHSLADYAAVTVHPAYGLVECLRWGVAYHHGKMPHHVRLAVEYIFKTEHVRVVACTTTLMQGVNLPAKTLIARNPNLFTRARSGSESPKLSGYEFGNLRGRAGRLMHDFVGRSIVLDGAEFEKEQLPLFEFPAKRLAHSYRQRFERYREELTEDLNEQARVDGDKKYNDLLIYVRQTILRHEEQAYGRMHRVGVAVDAQLIDRVRRQLDKLSAPRDFLVRFPYWDPLDLDKLWNEVHRSGMPIIPRSPFDSGMRQAIERALHITETVAPYYVVKYLGGLSGKALSSAISAAQGWSCGVQLNELLDWGPDHPVADSLEVDRRVDRVQNVAAYALPRVLEPVVAIQDSTNPILSFFEMGAYDPVARRLIELGVAREIALKLSQIIPKGEVTGRDGELNDASLLKAVEVRAPSLAYWERVLLMDLLPQTSASTLGRSA